MSQKTETNQKVTPSQPEPTSSSKKKYEFVMKAGLMIVFAMVSVVLNKVYIFQTDLQFKDKRMGVLSQLLMYGLPFAAVFSVFDWFVHYVFDDVCQKYYINWEKYPVAEDRKKRCYTLVKWTYSIGYYLISSIWGYKIMTDSTFLHTWLGGKGDPFTFVIQNSIPYNEVTFQMKIFYILQFGKHFSRFFGHAFIRSEGNFYQYALHHGLSVFLIAFSYLSNLWWFGITVLILHDYSDFALILARLYRDYKYLSKKVLNVIYVHAFGSWVGCRIILFNYICIFPAIYALMENLKPYPNEYEKEIMRYPSYMMTIMMVMLELLQIFWTYYIAESFISVQITPKVRHSYD